MLIVYWKTLKTYRSGKLSSELNRHFCGFFRKTMLIFKPSLLDKTTDIFNPSSCVTLPSMATQIHANLGCPSVSHVPGTPVSASTESTVFWLGTSVRWASKWRETSGSPPEGRRTWQRTERGLWQRQSKETGLSFRVIVLPSGQLEIEHAYFN